MYIQTEETPNPNALKFLPGKTVLKTGTIFISNKEDAIRSPLARKLFNIAHVEAVFLGSDFITVTKAEQARWEILKPMILTEVMDYYVTGEVLESEDKKPEVTYDDSDPIIKQIVELIETRVRPAVAMDGGDIIFKGFNQGIVQLELHGSCSGCPSSSATLKDGIENMLKHYVPEVVAVEAVA